MLEQLAIQCLSCATDVVRELRDGAMCEPRYGRKTSMDGDF
jgi:hypothetical protein